MIELVTNILWLSAALGVFCTVVFFMLSPIYAIWIENKYHIDLESNLYEQISKAIEKATEEGLPIQVQIIIGEEEVEEEG